MPEVSSSRVELPPFDTCAGETAVCVSAISVAVGPCRRISPPASVNFIGVARGFTGGAYDC